MFVPCLGYLAIAILTIYTCVHISDEIIHTLMALLSLICLFFSLIYAPAVLKLLIIFAVLISNKHANTLNNS